MDDSATGHGNGEQVATSFFGALLNGQGHLLRLAVAETNSTIAITDHDQCGEGKPATALNDFGHAVDGDDARFAQAVRIGSAFTPTVTAATATLVVSSETPQNSSPASRAADATAAIRPW